MSDTSTKITIRIAIDIPVEVAAETVQIIEPALARLTAGLGGKPETTVESEPVEDLRQIAREELERKKTSFLLRPLEHTQFIVALDRNAKLRCRRTK